jgi:hypothetical protein
MYVRRAAGAGTGRSLLSKGAIVIEWVEAEGRLRKGSSISQRRTGSGGFLARCGRRGGWATLDAIQDSRLGWRLRVVSRVNCSEWKTAWRERMSVSICRRSFASTERVIQPYRPTMRWKRSKKRTRAGRSTKAHSGPLSTNSPAVGEEKSPLEDVGPVVPLLGMITLMRPCELDSLSSVWRGA